MKGPLKITIPPPDDSGKAAFTSIVIISQNRRIVKKKKIGGQGRTIKSSVLKCSKTCRDPNAGLRFLFFECSKKRGKRKPSGVGPFWLPYGG